MDTGESVLPERVGKDGSVEVLWDAKDGWVLKGHDRHVHLNARLAKLAGDITTSFERLYDQAPYERVSKEALVAAIFPAAQAKPVAVAALGWSAPSGRYWRSGRARTGT